MKRIDPTNPNYDALLMRQKLDKLKAKRSKLTNQIVELDHNLQQICKHITTEIKDRYIEGSYLDKSMYIKEEICTVCGKIVWSNTKIGDYS